MNVCIETIVKLIFMFRGLYVDIIYVITYLLYKTFTKKLFRYCRTTRTIVWNEKRRRPIFLQKLILMKPFLFCVFLTGLAISGQTFTGLVDLFRVNQHISNTIVIQLAWKPCRFSLNYNSENIFLRNILFQCFLGCFSILSIFFPVLLFSCVLLFCSLKTVVYFSC